ncbi:MAG: 2-oxoacid:acceptor oxidoreductase subunit alpha [Bacteroidota bacterium]|nr:2-oxoacid:acceptor oxidoreductase subunit alpha [Bacteroidota bacterium]
MSKNADVIEKEKIVVRFSGDSGDGMQLSGTLFSDTSAFLGNDLSTFPNYPSEIRAPQGTIGGVSGFQVNVGHSQVSTPGDYADILIAMNPAALKANVGWVKTGGIIIYDEDSFDEKGLKKAGYKTDNPIEEDKLDGYKIINAPISTLTKEALKDIGLDNKSVLRSKNMFALGLVYWLVERPLEFTEKFFEEKFKKKPLVIEANKKVLKAGYYYAETAEHLTHSYKVAPADIEKGTYRNISGNIATAWGLIAASEKANLNLFCGSYPITPATEILQELSLRKSLNVKTFQAEDEIAGVCTSIGASFAGSMAVTTTSGPGLALKTEAIGLAVITELPLVIVNVQRGGPSTGLPTKPEQADLMQALYARNGESPLVVMAASTPSDCFHYAFMAGKIALEHMTPVILLTDGFIANGSEPWRIPNMADYPKINPPIVPEGTKDWQPYARDVEKLARTWAVPGTKGLEHRIGGLEKSDITGDVSQDPANHQKMTDIREQKVQNVAKFIPELEVEGDKEGDILVVGWGGTYGHLATAVKEMVEDGKSIALAHFNFIKPLPINTKDIFKKYKKIVVCEINMGQFVGYLRMNLPEFEYSQYNKVQGLPFTTIELKNHFEKLLEEK